jgi:hypothetical protein
MKNGKSQWFDGPPCEFKAMWGMIRDDFCCLVVEVFSFEMLIESLNQGLITLIPKNVARDTIGGWRPITLLNVAYKIMAKVVALWIHLVVLKVVS